MRTTFAALLIAGLAVGAACAADDIEKLDASKFPQVKTPAKLPGDQTPLIVKVLVLDFNPLIPGKLHSPDQPDAKPKGLREVAGWNDPIPLAQGYMQDLCEASGGLVQFKIVEWQVVRRFQKKTDGFTYTPEQYMTALKAGTRAAQSWHQPDGVDYPNMVKEFDLIARVESGEIDEVWMMGLPYFGYFEACMIGKDAFDVNGHPFRDVPCKRRFVVMGFNVERGVECMLEDQCHRSEATLSRIYGGWRAEQLTSNWARFAANEKQSGTAAVGTAHYPANGEKDYDYANERSVESTADDWLNYPNLTGKKRTFNREEWAGPHQNKAGKPDYHRNYMRWWFTHLPKAPGVNEDARLNNWWEYLYNFNAYDAKGKPLSDAKPAEKDAKERKPA
jgi:hypothetical protein